MKPYRTVTASFGLALMLAACSSLPAFLGSTGCKIQTVIDNFKADVAAFETGVSGVVEKLNSGAGAAGQDLQMVCGGISMMNGLYQAVAPLAGASAADTADEKLAMASANALCNAPAPTDLASAVATGLSTYKTIKSAVAAAAPQAMASSP